jgi:poly-gamma-glutamate synthesis protein (capsule biosynthesis protein)
MIARVTVDRDGVVEAGFVPCRLDTDAVPRPLTGAEADATIDYVERITADAGLSAEFTRRGPYATFLDRTCIDRAVTGERTWA